MGTFGWIVLGAIVLIALFGITIYNRLVSLRQTVGQAWSDISVQLKQRHDLIPNLVETVKGYAAHEKEVLEAVVEARAKATQMQLPADILTNPEAFERFQQVQGQITGALARLLAVVENYPDLKANQNFLALQSQLEGTENRVSVARRDYIEAVRLYNTELKTIPGVIWKSVLYSDRQPMQQFSASEGAKEVPKVNFGK